MVGFGIFYSEGKRLIDLCRENVKEKVLLEVQDLDPLEEVLSCKAVMAAHDKYQESLRLQDKNDSTVKLRGSLLSSVMHLVRKETLVSFLLAAIRIGSFFVQIFALSEILEVVGGNPQNRHIAWQVVFVALLGIGSFFQSLMQHNIFSLSYCSGLRVRALLCGLTCRKTLQQTPLYAGKASGGQQMNLISSDANIVVEWLMLFVYLFSPAVEVVLALVWIGLEIRWATFATLGAVLFLMPLQVAVGHFVGKFRGMSFGVADKRLRALGEYLSGISVVKMNGWEQSVSKRVHGLRRDETSLLARGNTVKLLNLTFFFFVPGVLALTTFGVLNTYDTEMDPRKTFVVMALLQIIARGFAFVPRSVAAHASAMTSIARVESFLQLDFESGLPPEEGFVARKDTNFPSASNEPFSSDPAKQAALAPVSAVQSTRSKDGTLTSTPGGQGDIVVRLSGMYGWDGFSLRNVDLTAIKGSVTVIVGSVGSGKSTLLQAIMRCCGDRNPTPASPDPHCQDSSKGIYYVGANYAYVPQEAWIADGTIRDNIVFGHEFDEEKYLRVIEACALAPDICAWSGDLVEVGEKGITLSGGQRQRVAMARACYSDAPLILLDDPISAVDAHVAKQLLERCIRGYLSGRTIIQVSHHPKPLDFADCVIALSAGEQVYYGPVCDLPESFIPTIAGGSAKNTPTCSSPLGSGVSPLGRRAGTASGGRSDESSPLSALAKSGTVDQSYREWIGKGRPLTSKEKGEIGSVGASIYGRYCAQGGLGLFALFWLLFLLAQGSRNVAEWWFAAWTERQFNLTNHQYVMIELGLVGGIAVFGALRCVVFAVFTLKASTGFHDKMFRSVLYSPMHFFETVPLGRIMNRFAKDLDYCDDWVPRALYDFLQLIGTTIGSLALLIYVLPYFAIAVALFVVLFTWLLSLYLPCARQLKRLEGVSRSPTHQLFQQALSGLTTLRSFNRENALLEQFYDTVDITTRTILGTDVTQRWIGIRMDWGTMLWVVAVGALCLGFQDTISRSLAGLAIGQSLMLTGQLQFAVRCAALAESLMTSVERMDEYSRLPPEEDVPKDHKLVEQHWPTDGTVEVRHLTAAYPSAPDQNVLHDLSFRAFSGEKVAVVGRTGAGKSTLLSCFFRLMRIPRETIFISDVATSELDNHTLRSRLGVIPQTSTLFGGTLRDNIDPFHEYADEEVCEALRKVQLSDLLVERGLESEVTEGAALSVGQKQLVCAARAIIRRPKVLLMDEATANVDGDTDQRIQVMIKDECKHVTVITIAHRLHTVLHYDTVIVLDRGKLVEMGNPIELGGKGDGVFAGMLKAMELEHRDLIV